MTARDTAIRDTSAGADSLLVIVGTLETESHGVQVALTLSSSTGVVFCTGYLTAAQARETAAQLYTYALEVEKSYQ
jgi:hypothetical protein